MQLPLNAEFPKNIALVEAEASFTYAEVEQRTTEFASGLLDQSSDLAEARIAFPCSLPVLTM
jgi:non-ribosomal peptide synthetase component E (peptide arylation enzyme)